MFVLLCFLNPTSAIEIRYIINQLNTNKVVVLMGLKQNLLCLRLKFCLPVLAILFNICFDFRIFPTCLKTTKVVPVDKAGDENEVTNYRPILILSIFSKILQILVHTRTLSFLKFNSVLTPTQYGFRPKHSTMHVALLDITNSTLNNIGTNYILGLYFKI